MNRLNDAYEQMLGHNQYGFRQNRSTTDAIFVLKNILKKTSRPLIAVFIDLKSAYDWIPRDALLKVIQFRTGASKIVNIIRESFRNTEAKIKGSKDKFATASGLKQGSLDSPPYFNIYFDFCIEVAKHQIKHKNLCHQIKMNYQIPLECVGKREERNARDTRGVIKIEEEEYADDLICITGTIEEAKVTTEVYNDTFARFGLTIAREKTETMSFNVDESTKTKESLFLIN